MTQAQLNASNPLISAWVSASAGTGKTHVLTSRVFRLLLSGTTPDRILCLTFTKAAAAEMSNRVQATLARWVTYDDAVLDAELRKLGVDDPAATRDRARRLFAEVLETAGGLKIQTIHAFCQSLLARFPLEAALPPHFRLIEDRTAAEVLSSAVDRVLVKAARGEDTQLAEALARINRRLSEYNFDEFVRAFLGERNLLERLERAFQTRTGLHVAIRRILGLDTAMSEENVFADFLAHEPADALRQAIAALEVGTAQDVARGQKIAGWLVNDARDLRGFYEYSKIYLTDKEEIRSRLTTKAVNGHDPAAADILKDEAVRVLTTIEQLRLIEVADNTTAALTIVFEIMRIYAREKMQQAAVDYDDLIIGTVNLLQRPGIASWVLFKLDGGLDHVLVDEAQDTNPEQWQVIRALADDFFAGASARDVTRSIFAVGDVKQSIYRFQRAEPRNFRASRDHFLKRVEAVQGQFLDVPLDLSFRSTSAVLEYVDAVFSDLKLRADLLDDQYERHGTVRGEDAGLVEIWPIVTGDMGDGGDDGDGWALPTTRTSGASAPARLALKIAAQIKQWLSEGNILESQGRPVAPGDILVLVRRRSNFVRLLLSALKLMDVPVAGADRMVVADQLVVMDLIALCRFALLPDDDLTLATVLKSPLLGLSEDEVYALAYGRPGTLWARVRERGGATADYLGEVLGLADRLTPFDFFATLLNDRDQSGQTGRMRIIGRLGHEAHDPIDEFLSLALTYEQGHTASLEGFLHWLEARDIEIKRDMEQGRDEVRIMTVHGSKGLQAPIVILPDTCEVPKKRNQLIPLDGTDGVIDRLLVWPGQSKNAVGTVQLARDFANRLEEEEQARLLYVALTRAADRLYIAGWSKNGNPQSKSWYEHLSAAFERLDGVTEREGVDGTIRTFIKTQRRAVQTDRGASITRGRAELPAWALNLAPDEPTPARPLTPSRPSEEEPAVQSPMRAAAKRASNTVRFRRGTLIHRLLERLPSLDPLYRQDAAVRYLRDPVYDLSAEEIAQIIGEVMGIIDHPDFAPIFSKEAQAEVPIAGLVNHVPIAGQIDRLLVTADRVMVVDYKTNRPPPARVEDVAPAYIRQMAAYRRLLMDIYPGRAIVCGLLWTDEARLMIVPDQMLEQVTF